jgi:hypothetical protein
MKKITAIISNNHKVLARKVLVLGGVTLGIGIGLLLNKVDEDPDMVIIDGEYTEEETWESSDDQKEPEALEGKVVE